MPKITLFNRVICLGEVKIGMPPSVFLSIDSVTHTHMNYKKLGETEPFRNNSNLPRMYL